MEMKGVGTGENDKPKMQFMGQFLAFKWSCHP